MTINIHTNISNANHLEIEKNSDDQSNKYHDIWKRDFSGAAGIFSIQLDKKYSIEKLSKFYSKYFSTNSKLNSKKNFVANQENYNIENLIISKKNIKEKSSSKELEKNQLEKILPAFKTEKTYFKAYEKTELEYQEHFGKTRYSSYDSFRVVMNRKLKKKK